MTKGRTRFNWSTVWAPLRATELGAWGSLPVGCASGADPGGSLVFYGFRRLTGSLVGAAAAQAGFTWR